MDPRPDSESEQAYAFVVKAARAFKFSAAEIYVRRLLSEIGVPRADLRTSHFARLCSAALDMRGDEMSKEGCDAFIAELREHGKTHAVAATQPVAGTCPKCQATAQTGKFCSLCGARLG